jgi:hypothetical protein
LEAHHLRTARDLDADGDDGGLHLLDDVGKSHRALDALGVGDRVERGAGLREDPRTAEQHGHAETSNAGEQNETTRGEDARFLSGNARSHKGHSIVLCGGGLSSTPSANKMEIASLPGAVGEIKSW